MNKTILIIGTGTIGGPLIGLVADFKNKIGVNKVLFHKRTPLDYEVSKVNNFIDRGALLVTDTNKIQQFRNHGHNVYCDMQSALDEADVIIDCTPAGNENKMNFYSEVATKYPNKIFIAQGSEKGFGIPYAHGINDIALRDNKFIQVVSCNTHNIACLLKTIPQNVESIIDSDFVCIRRANDISQSDGYIPSPVVSKHSDLEFGTHHARDAYDLFTTIDQKIPIFSSAMKLNTQYMHAMRFTITTSNKVLLEDVKKRIRKNMFAATTKYPDAGRIFSFGRDHGYYGRILNQTVIVEDTLFVRSVKDNTKITGFVYTPQDGNSLSSSVAAAMHALHKDHVNEYMSPFYKYLFRQI